jgi:hypothetical protein
MGLSREGALKEIKNTIEWFSAKQFSCTVNGLQFIHTNIEREIPREFNQDIQGVFTAYFLDVRKRGVFSYRCSDLIGKIFFKLIVLDELKFRNSLEDTYPFIQLWLRAQKNHQNMSELTRNKDISVKARYYLYCFGYLISVEGSYSNWVKILYRLICKFEQIPVDIELIHEWNPSKVKKKLVDIDPEYEMLFEGYFDGKLRNAIGHGDFSYLSSNNKMRFQHTRGNFNETMSIKEFYENFKKIMTISDTGYELLLLIRLMAYHRLVMG